MSIIYLNLTFFLYSTFELLIHLNFVGLSGSVGSSICLPWFTSHNVIPEEERLHSGVTKDLVRLSVGIEDVSDLITSLDKSLSSGTF